MATHAEKRLECLADLSGSPQVAGIARDGLAELRRLRSACAALLSRYDTVCREARTEGLDLAMVEWEVSLIRQALTESTASPVSDPRD